MEFLNNKIWKPQTILGVIVGVALVTASTSFGQNILFHLLGGSLPVVSFTTTSQNFNESNGVAAPWPAAMQAWSKRRQIILNGGTGALSNYTVLLPIDSTKIDYTAAGTNGISLRFLTDAGASLPFEIETWNPAGTSYVWVKVPSLPAYPSRASIWMYYGNGAAASGQSAATTWDATFQKVINFGGTSGAAIAHGAGVLSSVGSNATANNSGSGMSYSDGAVGTAVVLDGVDDWINLGADTGFNVAANAPFSVAITFKTTDGSGPLATFRDAATDAPVIGFHIGHNGASMYNGNVHILVRDNTNGAFATIVGPVVNDNQWHHAILSRDAGSTISLLVDGVSFGAVSTAASGGAITTDLRALGSERRWVANSEKTPDDRYLSGMIDQFRFANSQLGPDWMAANLLAMRNELALFQSEESFGVGTASITAQLNSSPPTTVTVPYTVTGTATSGADYAALSGSLVIPAGNTTVGSSRVDLQACKLEYSIVSPK